VYGLSLFVIAIASSFNGFLVGMAISGLGFGVYVAVDLALVVDVLPGQDRAAKDLGVFNIAGALPFSIAPALAPVILAVSNGSYGVLYAVAGRLRHHRSLRHPAGEGCPMSAYINEAAGPVLGPAEFAMVRRRPRGMRAGCWLRSLHL